MCPPARGLNAQLEQVGHTFVGGGYDDVASFPALKSGFSLSAEKKRRPSFFEM